jgi:ribonuclease HI
LYTFGIGGKMEDCIFCKIIRGEIPSYKIYEDNYTYSFLDISNDGNGHILVVPKKHCENVLDCEEGQLAHVLETVKKIGNHLVNNCGFNGINILNASGKAAEQSVFHLHFHILPRKDGDGLSVFPKLEKNDKTLEQMCQLLKIENEKEEEKVVENSSNCKNIVLYTDGACSGNPGMGGWGAILSYNGKEKELSDGEEMTTNNRMELIAVIKGLEAIKESCKVDIYSDSAYVVNAFLQDWISKWKSNGWKTTKGEVLNLDLWKRLTDLLDKHEVVWHKVKGHADNALNNRCDALARGEIEKLKKTK